MSQETLEKRVTVLERMVAQIAAESECLKAKKSWRNTIGTFAGNPIAKAIDEEGRKIRQAERSD
jgi:hypothetical protein